MRVWADNAFAPMLVEKAEIISAGSSLLTRCASLSRCYLALHVSLNKSRKITEGQLLPNSQLRESRASQKKEYRLGEPLLPVDRKKPTTCWKS